ncbi:OmpW/AlkL family protein [Roseovarius sp. ZX-A-9]|uniref:OmpW/AlkL family protein n=1 Tax=Roseovarius sp. ZX-A-9 TaxID=3014783 RepID=UPI00233063C3|nr:OmpW family outer membrane protein [Roseovarius sp. ZX-A-9]
MTRTVSAIALVAAIAAPLPTLAQSQGDWTLGFGIHNVSPQGGDSATTPGLIDVEDNARPTLTFEYFVADRIGIEVLAAWPFEHDINLVGTGKVATTKHLPPTISLQYHFVNNSTMTPFVGVGINYTHFFDEQGVGALAASAVDLSDSWGLAAHAGVDFKVSDRGALRLDVRYIDIESDLKINGVKQGKVKIDPLVFGVAYVHRF